MASCYPLGLSIRSRDSPTLGASHMVEIFILLRCYSINYSGPVEELSADVFVLMNGKGYCKRIVSCSYLSPISRLRLDPNLHSNPGSSALVSIRPPALILLNPLTPSDWHLISPFIITFESNKKVMRI